MAPSMFEHFCAFWHKIFWPRISIPAAEVKSAIFPRSLNPLSGEEYLGTMIMALNRLVAARVSLRPQVLSVDGSQKHTCISLYV